MTRFNDGSSGARYQRPTPGDEHDRNRDHPVAGRVRRVRPPPRERAGVGPALRRTSPPAARCDRGRRRGVAVLHPLGHRQSRRRIPPWRWPERPHLGHRRPRPRSRCHRLRPTRPRSLLPSRRQGLRPVAQRRGSRPGDRTPRPRRLGGGWHVARRGHHHPPRLQPPRALPPGGDRRRHPPDQRLQPRDDHPRTRLGGPHRRAAHLRIARCNGRRGGGVEPLPGSVGCAPRGASQLLPSPRRSVVVALRPVRPRCSRPFAKPRRRCR